MIASIAHEFDADPASIQSSVAGNIDSRPRRLTKNSWPAVLFHVQTGVLTDPFNEIFVDARALVRASRLGPINLQSVFGCRPENESDSSNKKPQGNCGQEPVVTPAMKRAREMRCRQYKVDLELVATPGP